MAARKFETLQVRRNWRTDRENLKVGDIVKSCNELVRRDDWPIGRMGTVYSGDDGVVRVVKLISRGKIGGSGAK
jgi:hypothetical protein